MLYMSGLCYGHMNGQCDVKCLTQMLSIQITSKTDLIFPDLTSD